MKINTSLRNRDSKKRWRSSCPSDMSGRMYCQSTPPETSDVSKESLSSGFGSCNWETGGGLGTRAAGVG